MGCYVVRNSSLMSCVPFHYTATFVDILKEFKSVSRFFRIRIVFCFAFVLMCKHLGYLCPTFLHSILPVVARNLLHMTKFCFQSNLIFHTELHPLPSHVMTGLFHFSNLYFISFPFIFFYCCFIWVICFVTDSSSFPFFLSFIYSLWQFDLQFWFFSLR